MIPVRPISPEAVQRRQEALAKYYADKDQGDPYDFAPIDVLADPAPPNVERETNVRRLPRPFLLRVLDWLTP